MTRKAMSLSQFNNFMRRCNSFNIRYVTPTIHPKLKQVFSITIHTSEESIYFTITNNPDENFDLNKAVNNFLDNLEGEYFK